MLNLLIGGIFMSNQIKITAHLLSHPWYQKWECGELSQEALQSYSRQYYWQVANFPRYLSRLHSQMEVLEDRQVILGNLLDEENKNSPHPELWLDFAEALGEDRQSIKEESPSTAVAELVEEFHRLVNTGKEEGLGAILAYESQVPEVARFKSQALKKFYLGPEQAEKGARFFDVHAEADVWHTQELDQLVAKMTDEQKSKVQAAADQACSALWRFLDTLPN